MADDLAHVVRRETSLRKRIFHDFLELRHRESEDFLAVHAEVAKANRVVGVVGWNVGFALWNVQRVSTDAVGTHVLIDAALGWVGVGLNDRATGRIAEENRHRAIGVIENRTHRFAADDGNGACASDAHHGFRHVERVNETAARRDEVESRRVLRANRARDATRDRWARHLHRDGCHDDEIEIFSLDAGIFDRALECALRERRATLRAEIKDASLLDAGALRDPLVARVEHAREVVVCEATLGDHGTRAEDTNATNTRWEGLIHAAGSWIVSRRALMTSLRPVNTN